MTTTATVEIDWDHNGSYTDESAYLVSASGNSALRAPESFIVSPRGQVDQCQIVLDNSAASPRFALNDGTAIQAPVRVSVNTGSGAVPIFTGVIGGIRYTAQTPAAPASVVVTCYGVEYRLLQLRMSSTTAQFRTWFASVPTESHIIRQWLVNAGLTDGTHFKSQAWVEANGGTATLDRGLFRIRWAWLDDESPLEEIWQLAAACGGRVYADRDGWIRYENMEHWLLESGTTAVGRGDYVGLDLSMDDRELYGSITIEASARELGNTVELWTPDEPVVVPPSGRVDVLARMDQPRDRINTVSYRPTTFGGQYVANGVTYEMSNRYAQRITLTFYNQTAQALVLQDLVLVGQSVVGERGYDVTVESDSSYWTTRVKRNRSVRDNPYIQSRSQALRLAQFLRDRHENARLAGSIRGLSNPEIWCGSRLAVTDSPLLASARTFYVLGVRWTMTAAGFSSDCEIMEAASLYPYATTVPRYFVVGTSTLSNDTTRGRLFY